MGEIKMLSMGTWLCVNNVVVATYNNGRSSKRRHDGGGVRVDHPLQQKEEYVYIVTIRTR